ncbi:MAG TPA: cytochrome P450 [Acidimicrobiales bacterium]|nr:cytochrome P450 [Acidimicrobiales bacterium]
MTDTANAPTDGEAQFDHHSLAHAADPACSYRALRQSGGVVHSDKYGGYYVLSRYDDIVKAARDHGTFSSTRDVDGPGSGGGGLSIPPNPATHLSLDELDPPAWKRIRSAMNPLLSPTAVERMKPRIAELTTYFIDRFIEAGRADLVLQLANPIPAIVTLDFLGLPRDEWERFADPIHKMVYIQRDQPTFEPVFNDIKWILGRLQQQIDLRRREPTADMVTYLLQHPADGDPFRDDELLELMFITLAGGVDTTTALMSNTFYYLSEHPEDRRRLQADPSLIDSACEEFLRVFTPVQALARTVTRDVSLGEVEMHPGDRVLLAWASANRDDSQFEAADEVQIDRFPNRHCAFGIGIHRCLGSNLARTQYKHVVTEVLRRLPDFEVVPGAAHRYERLGTVNGWEQMPVTFTPGEREGRNLTL